MISRSFSQGRRCTRSSELLRESTSAAPKRGGFAVSFCPRNSSRGGISESTQHTLRIVEALHCKVSVFPLTALVLFLNPGVYAVEKKSQLTKFRSATSSQTMALAHQPVNQCPATSWSLQLWFFVHMHRASPRAISATAATDQSSLSTGIISTLRP